MLHKSVELLCSVFVLVAAASHADTHAAGKVADAVAPDVLVQLGVNANILQCKVREKIINISNKDANRIQRGNTILETSSYRTKPLCPHEPVYTVYAAPGSAGCSEIIEGLIQTISNLYLISEFTLVCMTFSANFLISRIARGALFLN